MHFTGVLGTNAWAGVYVTQVCFTPTYTSAWALCICMRMHMDAYVRL